MVFLLPGWDWVVSPMCKDLNSQKCEFSPPSKCRNTGKSWFCQQKIVYKVSGSVLVAITKCENVESRIFVVFRKQSDSKLISNLRTVFKGIGGRLGNYPPNTAKAAVNDLCSSHGRYSESSSLLLSMNKL